MSETDSQGETENGHEAKFVGGPLDGEIIRMFNHRSVLACSRDGQEMFIYSNTDGPFWEVTDRRPTTESERLTSAALQRQAAALNGRWRGSQP